MHLWSGSQYQGSFTSFFFYLKLEIDFSSLFNDRFIIIYRPQSIQKITYLRVGLGIKLSISYGIFWSMAPLFGWSHYSLESNDLFCSVEWKERTLNVLSYNVCMFVFVFFIPLVIIGVMSTKTLKIVIIFFTKSFIKQL